MIYKNYNRVHQVDQFHHDSDDSEFSESIRPISSTMIPWFRVFKNALGQFITNCPLKDVITSTYCLSYFCTKKRKQNILHKHSQISVYLFTHFYFFLFISTQFSDFAFRKIWMQITFAKWFNVLNNRIWSMLQKKILVNNFIKFLSKIFPLLSEFSLRM